MSVPNPKVSVLVLNYNGKRFLDDCFNSLYKTTYPDFEIVMVDNLSTDDSVDYVKAQHPAVKVFSTGANAGFSLAYNKSFAIAQGKYVVLLNNDVTVEPNWLEPLVEVCEANPDIAAVQPKLLSMLDPKSFEYAGASGGFLDKFGFPFLRGRVFTHMEADNGQYNDEVFIHWATGAALFARLDVLLQIEGLDNEFVHHMEEIDLCYRMLLAGYKIKVVPRSVIYHFGGATITPDSYRKMYWNHRNSTFMLLKNVGDKHVTSIVTTKILLDLLAATWALKNFDFIRIKAIFNGFAWLIKNRSMIKAKRKKIQENRVVSDEDIFPQFYPKSIAIQFFFKSKKTFNELYNGLES